MFVLEPICWRFDINKLGPVEFLLTKESVCRGKYSLFKKNAFMIYLFNKNRSQS